MPGQIHVSVLETVGGVFVLGIRYLYRSYIIYIYIDQEQDQKTDQENRSKAY